MTPDGAVEVATWAIVVAASWLRIALGAEVPLDAAVTGRGYHPADVAAAVPVLVADEGRISGPSIQLGPEGHREAVGAGDEVRTKGDIVEGRSVLGAAKGEGAGAHLAGREGRGTDRGTVVAATREVGGVAVEGQVSQQPGADRREVLEGLRHRHNNRIARDAATGVGGHQRVGAALGGGDRRQRQGGVGRAHDRIAVQAPLQADARTGHRGGQSAVLADDDRRCTRLGRELRRGHLGDGIEAHVVDAEVPTAGAGLGKAQADLGLVVGLGQAEELDPLGLHGIVVDAGLDERREAGPLGFGHADEGTVVLALGLAGDRILIGGRVVVGVGQGGDRIHIAVGVLFDVGAIDHVHDRQPSRTLIDGVLHRADAVLVLLVNAVERQEDVLLASQVDIGREGILDLVATADIGLGVQELADSQVGDLGPVDVGLGDVQATGALPLAGRTDRLNALLADEHPIQVGVAFRVIEVEGARSTRRQVAQGPTGRDAALGRRLEGLDPDWRRQGERRVVSHHEGHLGGGRVRRGRVVREGDLVGIGRLRGQQVGPGQRHNRVGGGAHNSRGRGRAIEGQLDRGRVDRSGQVADDHLDGGQRGDIQRVRRGRLGADRGDGRLDDLGEAHALEARGVDAGDLRGGDLAAPEAEVVDAGVAVADAAAVGVGAGTVIADVHRQACGVGVDGARGGTGRPGVLGIEQLTVDVGGDLAVALDGHGHVDPLAREQLAARAVEVLTRGSLLLEVPLHAAVVVGGEHEAQVAAAGPVLVAEEGRVTAKSVELHPHGHREVGGVAEEDVRRGAQGDEVGKRPVLGIAAEDRFTQQARPVGRLTDGGAVVALG